MTSDMTKLIYELSLIRKALEALVPVQTPSPRHTMIEAVVDCNNRLNAQAPAD